MWAPCGLSCRTSLSPISTPRKGLRVLGFRNEFIVLNFISVLCENTPKQGFHQVNPPDASFPWYSNSWDLQSYIHLTRRQPKEKPWTESTLNQLCIPYNLALLHIPFVHFIPQSSIDTEKPIEMNTSQNAAMITTFVSTARNLNGKTQIVHRS